LSVTSVSAETLKETRVKASRIGSCVGLFMRAPGREYHREYSCQSCPNESRPQ
jgi:hypothetical protein